MAEHSVDPSMPSGKRGASRRAATFDQERVVRRYLSGIESARPGRGTKRTSDAIGNRITKIDELLVSADPLSRVHLTQERIELHAEYVRVTNGNHADQSQLERDFTRVARSYGDRSGLTYAAWRQVGVDASVLERAGIHKAEKKLPPAAIRAAAEREAEPGGEKPARESPVPDERPAVESGAAALNHAPAPAPAPDRAQATATETIEPTEPTEPEPLPAESAEREPEAVPTEAVSMDELAALLADASVGSSPTPPSTQPRLGDELGSAGDDTPPPASGRAPGPATDDSNGT